MPKDENNKNQNIDKYKEITPKSPKDNSDTSEIKSEEDSFFKKYRKFSRYFAYLKETIFIVLIALAVYVASLVVKFGADELEKYKGWGKYFTLFLVIAALACSALAFFGLLATIRKSLRGFLQKYKLDIEEKIDYWEENIAEIRTQTTNPSAIMADFSLTALKFINRFIISRIDIYLIGVLISFISGLVALLFMFVSNISLLTQVEKLTEQNDLLNSQNMLVEAQAKVEIMNQTFEMERHLAQTRYDEIADILKNPSADQTLVQYALRELRGVMDLPVTKAKFNKEKFNKKKQDSDTKDSKEKSDQEKSDQVKSEKEGDDFIEPDVQYPNKDTLQNLLTAHKKEFNSYKLSGINLSGIELINANLQSADLWYANLQSADLRSAKLQSADLRSANLQSAYLRSANLQSAYLSLANLQSADLRSANLQSADLWNTNLQSANLWLAKLQSANLEDADLQSANLEDADLQIANLSFAELQSAYLRSANLQSAYLRKTYFIGKKQFYKIEQHKRKRFNDKEESLIEIPVFSWRRGDGVLIDQYGALFLKTYLANKLNWLHVNFENKEEALAPLESYKSKVEKEVNGNPSNEKTNLTKILTRLTNLETNINRNKNYHKYVRYSPNQENKKLLEDIFGNENVIEKQYDVWLGLENIYEEENFRIDRNSLPKLVHFGLDEYNVESQKINRHRTAWMDYYSYQQWLKVIADKREAWSKKKKTDIVKKQLELLAEFEKEVKLVNIIPDSRNNYCKTQEAKDFVIKWMADYEINNKSNDIKTLKAYKELWSKRIDWANDYGSLLKEIKKKLAEKNKNKPQPTTIKK